MHILHYIFIIDYCRRCSLASSQVWCLDVVEVHNRWMQLWVLSELHYKYKDNVNGILMLNSMIPKILLMWKTFNKNIIPGLTQIPGLSTCKCLYARCSKGLKCLHSKPGAHVPASCVGGLQANPQACPSCWKPRNMSKKSKWYRQNVN